MKYKGSTVDFAEHRSKALYRDFKRIFTESDEEMTMNSICEQTAECQAPRFWVSDTRAAIVISSMERADRLAEVNRKRKRASVGEVDVTDVKRAAIMHNIALGTVQVKDDAISNGSISDVSAVEESREYDIMSEGGAEVVLKKMYKERKEMYREIYRRYREERVKYPEKATVQIMADIIYSPAPRHYLSGYAVKRIIQRYRKSLKSLRG